MRVKLRNPPADEEEMPETLSQINRAAEFEKYIAGSPNLNIHQEIPGNEVEENQDDQCCNITEQVREEINPTTDKQMRETENNENMEKPQFTEITDKATNEVEYQCSMCNKTSISIGGIKNHISRTHKVAVITKEKSICRKCRNRIHEDSDAGTCTQCGGKEHYRCTKTSKENENEYKNGTLSFMCTLCCAPGLWEPTPDGIEEELITEAQADEGRRKAKDKEKYEEESKVSSHRNSKDETEGNKRKSLETQDSKSEIKQYMKREEAIIREANKIATDNTKLVNEINEMDMEIKQLKQALKTVRGNNKLLAVEMNRLKADNQRTASENIKINAEKKNIEMTHRKAQEIALNMKKKLSTTVREAKDLIRSKNEEIGHLVKTNEKLRAENQSYAEINNNIKNARRSNRGKSARIYDPGQLMNIAEYEDADDARYDLQSDEQDNAEDLYDYEQEEIDVSEGDHIEVEDYDYGLHARGETERSNMNNEWHQIGADERQWGDDDEYESDVAGEMRDHENEVHKSPKAEVIRYCHFFNHRDECTRKNCQFVHAIAPVCNNYMQGRCRRRFCGYSHPISSDGDEDTLIQSSFQNRRPLQPGEPMKTNNPQKQSAQNQTHRTYDNASISISDKKRIVTWKSSPPTPNKTSYQQAPRRIYQQEEDLTTYANSQNQAPRRTEGKMLLETRSQLNTQKQRSFNRYVM